jgi:autophagy-related protein 9
MILVQKTDTFLIKVYKYYMAKGYWPMIVSEIMSLATLSFFVLFTVIAFTCIDFSAVLAFREDQHQVPDIFDWHRMKTMNPFFIVCLAIFSVFFGYKIIQLFHHVTGYWSIRNFYRYTLKIREFELRTVPWNQIVQKIQKLQFEDQIFQTLTPMDAHEIANRIMRKDNYLIALINKDILNFRIQYAAAEHPWLGWIYNDWARQYLRFDCISLSKAIEWNIGYCLVNYFFDENMHVKPRVKSEHLQTLTASLRMRFRIMAVVNLCLMPFILVYVILYMVFKHGEQFYKDPQRLGSRNWSRLARWKFREFNELPHVFDSRLKQAEDLARDYVNQFPSKYLDIFSKFLVFVLSSFVITMLFMGLFNAQLFTKDVVWWITMCGTAIAVSRVFITDPSPRHPHETMKQVARVIHYIPPDWEQNAHRRVIFRRFLRLFEYRLITLLKEILGVMLAPFMLWYILPPNAMEIVQFFKDCSTSQPGLGLLCEFAMFDFTQNGDPLYGSYVDPKDDNNNNINHHRCKQGKMEKSFVNFQSEHPDWTPRGSLALLSDSQQPNELLYNNDTPRDIYRKLEERAAAAAAQKQHYHSLDSLDGSNNSPNHSSPNHSNHSSPNYSPNYSSPNYSNYSSPNYSNYSSPNCSSDDGERDLLLSV